MSKRWNVIIRHKDGADTGTEIDEISDLHEIVERGRDFNDIDAIHVKYNWGTTPEAGAD